MGGPGSGRKKGGSNKSRLAAGKIKKAEITERVKSGGKQTKQEKNQFGKISKPKKSKREINQFGR